MREVQISSSNNGQPDAMSCIESMTFRPLHFPANALLAPQAHTRLSLRSQPIRVTHAPHLVQGIGFVVSDFECRRNIATSE